MSQNEYLFNEIFMNRKSIRQYDSTVKISRDEMSQILKEATQAPSSLNMQPWRFIVVDSKEGKEKIHPLMMTNTLQSDSSSAVIFVFGDLLGKTNKDLILSKSVEKGYMPKDVEARQSAMIQGYYDNATKEQLLHQITLDGGLICMSLMLVARNHGYDTCSIGGFDKKNMAETLGIDKNRYVPMLALSIGKADETGHDSYRMPIEDIAKWI